MSEIYNTYPKTFTVPEWAVKFKVVLHNKAVVNLPVNISISRNELSGIGISEYLIDGNDMLNFGLYISESKAIDNLPELKDQFFTKYGSEGYQITGRKNKTLSLDGFIIGASLTDMNVKIANLTLLFATEGLRAIKLKDHDLISCFATEGFKVGDIVVYNNGIAAKFNIDLIIV